VTVDPREAFELRAWARARLFAQGEFDLHDAVDELQDWAVRIGLVEQIGQDEVQTIMSAAFAEVREDLRAAEPAELLDPSAAPRGVAHSTLDAALYVARSGDTAGMRRFLDRHSAAERKAIIEHLSAWRRRHVA
jgi:hypothetical protein